MKKVLVTGAAGFIGYHVAKELLSKAVPVIGIDNLNAYYDPALKRDRIGDLKKGYPELFSFLQVDIGIKTDLEASLQPFEFDAICHLAAQAGVRFSLIDPVSYGNANLMGFLHVLELARDRVVQNFVFASSSSVYGEKDSVPYSEEINTDNPVSLYAATKKANEAMAYSYAHLFGIPTTGLRFFTVYGPWGRPDMAVFKFCKALFEGNNIDVYNYGKMERDFTFIDDIVNGVIASLERPFAFEIINLGNGRPVGLESLIQELEKATGLRGKTRYVSRPPGDVLCTWADVSKARRLLGYNPQTPLDEGIECTVRWYKDYFGVVGKI